MDVSIIIVSWNVKQLLRECLKSIEASTNTFPNVTVEVIIVDSASHDGSPEMIQDEFPNVKLLAQTENVGFTRGNNIGLVEASGKYLFLLNPDTIILKDAIPQMVQFLEKEPTVGIVGPHTLNSDGTTQSSRRRFPTKLLAFFESTWLQGYAPSSLLDHFYVREYPDYDVIDVDWVQGSAVMARRAVYETIGGLDTGYVMFSEELDWCKRAKDANWRVVYLGSAQIIHHGGKSTDQAGAQKHIYFQESKLRYYRKFHGRLFAELLRFFLLASFALQYLQELLKGMIGSKPEMRKARCLTYAQVLKSGLKVR